MVCKKYKKMVCTKTVLLMKLHYSNIKEKPVWLEDHPEGFGSVRVLSHSPTDDKIARARAPWYTEACESPVG